MCLAGLKSARPQPLPATGDGGVRVRFQVWVGLNSAVSVKCAVPILYYFILGPFLLISELYHTPHAQCQFFSIDIKPKVPCTLLMPCLLGADWRLQSAVMPDSRGPTHPMQVGCWLVWFVTYFYAEDVSEWSLPAVNNDPTYGSQAAVLGTILFNFGFVTTVPSWVNEKKPGVSVNKVRIAPSGSDRCFAAVVPLLYRWSPLPPPPAPAMIVSNSQLPLCRPSTRYQHGGLFAPPSHPVTIACPSTRWSGSRPRPVYSSSSCSAFRAPW